MIHTTSGAKRGCGKRKAGGLYLSVGVGPNGIPIWEFLIDPPTPFKGEPWQGIAPAEELRSPNWPEDAVVVRDMVSFRDYPSVASFVEEVRLLGLSRSIPSNVDFSQYAGKKLWLVLVHWRACVIFAKAKIEDTWVTPYSHCKLQDQPGHVTDCLYHTWPTAIHVHPKRKVQKEDGRTWIQMPSFRFDPLGVCQNRHLLRQELEGHLWRTRPPQWRPGAFMAIQPTHIEAVKYVPEGSNPQDSGLPVVVVKE